MSLVKLVKITLLGHTEDKHKTLADLQDLGCLQLIPFVAEGNATAAAGAAQGPSPDAREALQFLLRCPHKRRQVTSAAGFDPLVVERQTLALQRRLLDLYDERDFLRKRIADLQWWGNFEFPAPEEVDGWRLWFYVASHRQMRELRSGILATDLCWQVVNRDHRFVYLVVIAKEEPQDMPVARTHTGDKPLERLRERLDEVELLIEDAEAERMGLTRWCLLLAAAIDHLQDRAALAYAADTTCDVEPLFALQGWMPRAHVDELRAYAADRGLVLEIAEPALADNPPTLLRNPPAVAGGEDLVTFYMTPGYWTWDPSLAVMTSFALFFAMIVADAGYGAMLGLVLWLLWKRLAASERGLRLRNVFVLVVAATVAYGVATGGYFGIELPADGWLARLKVLDAADASVMMTLSIFIGVIHVVAANLMDAYRRGPHAAALAPIGWATVITGGLLLWLGLQQTAENLTELATVMLLAGFGLIIVFTGAGLAAGPRLLTGLLALTRVTNAFGDVLSYLRLFALGMASLSLAMVFNGIASEINDALPGLGLLLAALVLVIGHGLNFILSLMSAVVHGLRLNFIEFFNWGLQEEGNLFRAFKRKGSNPWKH